MQTNMNFDTAFAEFTNICLRSKHHCFAYATQRPIDMRKFNNTYADWYLWFKFYALSFIAYACAKYPYQFDYDADLDYLPKGDAVQASIAEAIGEMPQPNAQLALFYDASVYHKSLLSDCRDACLSDINSFADYHYRHMTTALSAMRTIESMRLVPYVTVQSIMSDIL